MPEFRGDGPSKRNIRYVRIGIFCHSIYIVKKLCFSSCTIWDVIPLSNLATSNYQRQRVLNIAVILRKLAQ
jgi:hypothetical protein